MPAVRRGSKRNPNGGGRAYGGPSSRWGRRPAGAWFFGQVFSASGTKTQSVAVSWFLLRLTGNGIDLGLTGTFTFLPVMLLGPYAGALVDRADRRKLLIVTQSAFAVLAVAVAVIIAAGVAQAWMLFLITVLTGIVFGPDNTARQVYVVGLVGTERVASAVGLYEVILNISRAAGPALGGAQPVPNAVVGFLPPRTKAGRTLLWWVGCP